MLDFHKPKEWYVGEFKIQLAIRDWFRLDGGILFGGIPKERWGKFWYGICTHIDERNRAQLSVNCFLITTPDGIRILVDTSFGDINQWKKETVGQFDMINGFNLFERGGWPEEIRLPQPDIVVPTHLHFDHAGGCFRRIGGTLYPTFPKAKFVMHWDELSHALSEHPKTRSSYLRETIAGIKVLVEKNRVMTITRLCFQLVKGVTLFKTRGHAPGHLSVKIESEGQTALIPGALFPLRNHALLACGVGNDTHPLDAVVWKERLLEEANKHNALIFLEHDPDVAFKVQKDEKGSYILIPEHKLTQQYQNPRL